jgi:hypothetical protein
MKNALFQNVAPFSLVRHPHCRGFCYTAPCPKGQQYSLFVYTLVELSYRSREEGYSKVGIWVCGIGRHVGDRVSCWGRFLEEADLEDRVVV